MGTLPTPFDMVMLNDIDRYHLVMDVIDRVPGLGSRHAHLRQAVVGVRLRARRYTRGRGEDIPAVTDWSDLLTAGGEEPTLGEVMDDYLADRRGSVSRRTLDADRWAIEHLRPLLGGPQPSVTPQLIDWFRRRLIAAADGLRERIAAGERPVE